MLNSTFLINDSVTNNGKTDYIIHIVKTLRFMTTTKPI